MNTPILITRSTLFLSVKGNNTNVSTSFIAKFEDGSEKVLNLTEKTPTSLLRDWENGENAILSKDECCLYCRDWSNNPTLGTWAKHYPKPLA